VSVGHRHFAANEAPVNDYHDLQEWMRFVTDHPLVLDWLGRPYRLSRDYQIPYLGGISLDGGTVFLDSRYHSILTCAAHRHTIDTAKTIPDHEIIEYVCVRFYGMRYDDPNPFRNPHIWANTGERLAVQALHCEWEPYNAGIDRQLSGIELEKLTRCPPTLCLFPYQAEPKLLAKIKAAQQEN
jgi:hypothetical protein